MGTKPYDERTDIEKIESQWRKLSGLHSREEWSAAIVRAATAAEIAANCVIRQEFRGRSQFDDDFVDAQLRWANGISGKIDRLLLPLFEGKNTYEVVRPLKATADKINKERNAVVHQGEFRDEEHATAVINDAKVFVETLVRIHLPDFALKERQ
jgi:hypothetical protein